MPTDASPALQPSAEPSRPGAVPAPPPKAGARKFRFPSSYGFTFMASPAHWDVYLDSEGRPHLLPMLREVRHTPGVNGVVHVKGHDQGDPTLAISRAQRDGWVPVPASWELEAFGTTYRQVHAEVPSYLHMFEGESGPIFLSIWNRLYQLGDSTEMERDLDGYIAFLKRIRDEVLPPMRRETWKALKSRLEGMASKGAPTNAPQAAKVAAEVIHRKLEVFKGGLPTPTPQSAPPRDDTRLAEANAEIERLRAELAKKGEAPQPPPSATPADAEASGQKRPRGRSKTGDAA